MSGAEAAKVLGTTTKILVRLVQLSIVNTVPDKDIPTRLQFWRSEIVALRQAWKESICLEEAARYLELSKGIVVGLAKTGILKSRRGPISDGSQRWLFDRSHVLALYETLATSKHTQDTDASDEIPLATATRLLSTIGLNAVAIIQEVISGSLHLRYREAALGTMPVLYRTEVLAFLANTKLERGWISRVEVAKILGVKPTIVTRWVRLGLLSPAAISAKAQHFEKNVIDRFAVEHVWTTEAAKLLGVTPLIIQTWARKGELHPVCGPGIDGCHRYLFRRADLERLQQDTIPAAL